MLLLRRPPFRPSLTGNPPWLTHLRLLLCTIPSPSDSTVSYLTSSCGLSPAAAITIANKFILRDSGNADSFLALFRSHGFTQIQIAHIITREHALISYHLEKKIKPKLDFLLDAGYSKSDLIKLICSDPSILKSSLENRIKPNFDSLKGILGTNKEAIAATFNSSRLLRVRLDKSILPNMNALLEIGIPVPRVTKLAVFYPRAMMKNPSHFNQAIDLLNKIGFDSSKLAFALGINVIAGLSPSMWNKKLDLYRSLGWPDSDIFIAFKNHPFCMLISEEKMKRNWGFFMEELHWNSSYMAARSNILSYSLDNTILPRYKLFQILRTSGITKISHSFASFLRIPKKKFLKDYVMKYGDQVPELLEIHKHELLPELVGCTADLGRGNPGG